MRGFFSDKYSSAIHFMLGIVAAFAPYFFVLMILYEYGQNIKENRFADIDDRLNLRGGNARIDLYEFCIGFIIAVSLIKLEIIPDIKLYTN
jgi:hypothetical protein